MSDADRLAYLQRIAATEADAIANFERIESLIKNGDIDKLPIKDIKKERDSLLRNSPTSQNPQFHQRWMRVNMALETRITSELHWWQKPLGLIVIGVVIAILSYAVTSWFSLK